MRRHVFYYELVIWEDFKNNIEVIISLEDIKDREIWAPSNTWRFTCKSFRRAIKREDEVSDKWNLLWDFSIPLKVKIFG